MEITYLVNFNAGGSYESFATVREIAEELEFEIINEGDLETRIYEASIYQIGYELCWFFFKKY